MRYLGIDYGAKRLGLAVSSEGIAFPRDVIENDEKAVATLRDIIDKERISTIIIGDTRDFGGMANPITKDAKAFAERVKKETGMAVVEAFEAGSSIEASRFAPEGHSKDDAAAAAIILQRYLDMKSSTSQE